MAPDVDEVLVALRARPSFPGKFVGESFDGPFWQLQLPSGLVVAVGLRELDCAMRPGGGEVGFDARL